MCFRVQLASDFSRRDVRDFCVNTSTTRQVCSLQCSKTIFMRDDLKIDHEIIKILRWIQFVENSGEFYHFCDKSIGKKYQNDSSDREEKSRSFSNVYNKFFR